MKDARHILVGLDVKFPSGELTDGSRAAVERAMWLAQLNDARVDFLHSVETDRFVEIGDRGYVVRHEGVTDAARASMEDAVRRFADEGVASQLRLRNEKPWLAITLEVLEHGADLVILGKHDDPDESVRLGSVSAKVLRKTPAAVFVVRPSSAFPPPAVLAATDLSSVGARVVREAAYVAEETHAELHVVHAFQIPLEEQWTGSSLGGDLGALHDSAIEKVREEVRSTGTAVEPHLHVGCASPSRSIIACQEDTRADLLVMGTMARGGLAGFLLGNTAEKVLNQVPCSLLVLKPEDFVCPVKP